VIFSEFSLRDLLIIHYGKSLPAKSRIPGKFPVYGSSGITGYHNEYMVKGPSLIVGRKGSIGTVYFSEKDFFPIDTVYFIEVMKEKLDLEYAYYLLQQTGLSNLNTDAAVPGLNRDIFYSVKVNIPSIEVQRAIARPIFLIDTIIKNNIEQIQSYEKLIKTYYSKWFINFKFPNYEQVEFVDGIPDGWELKSVSELTQLISRGITPKYNDESGKSIVINQKCIRDNKLNLELARRQDKEIPVSKLVQKGDVLINSTGAGTLGRITQVHEDLPDTTVDTHVTLVRPLNEISSAWFGAEISNLESYIETLGEGATNQLELKREVIGKIDLVCPTIEIQYEFQKIVEPMHQQILNLMKENAHLLKLKENLLPRLMSGELDVSKLSSIE
jgi:type I restriction enzyme S subunit